MGYQRPSLANISTFPASPHTRPGATDAEILAQHRRLSRELTVENRALAEDNERLWELLANLFWEDPYIQRGEHIYRVCAWCGTDQDDGHSEQCPWSAAYDVLTRSE